MYSSIRTLALAAAVAVSANCGEAALEDQFIVISAAWEEVGNVGHTFFFTAVNDGGTEGTFTGDEFETPTSQENPVTGTWAQSRIQFTVTRTAGATTYSGEFTSATDLLNLQSSRGGTLTIRRRQ